MILRPYQAKAIQQIHDAWTRGKNPLYVLPCRGGKTPIAATLILNNVGGSVAIAHRTELIVQMSCTLARNGVRHKVIGDTKMARECTRQHMLKFGKNYVNPTSLCAVASVQTLVNMSVDDPWLRTVTLVFGDEGHHFLKKNIWGRAVAMFPNARILLVSATPCRADGHGLGSHADGVIDELIIGPSGRELTLAGYLANYRIFCPPSDVDVSAVPISAGGDFSPEPLRKAVHKSHVVGDIVEHYMKIAPGKMGMTFAVDVDGATQIANEYRCAGIPAEAISAKTEMNVRMILTAKHQNNEILQLVNVDLFGEGVDIPRLEVVSLGRPTNSLGTYIQQVTRPFNPEPGKTAIIIDHVGNVHRHGLPDARREWTLDRREKRSSASTPTTVRTCPDCTGTYDRSFGMTCPYCKYVVEPAGRSAPEQVDGHLYELDEATLARMRGERDASPTYHPDPLVCMSVAKKHREKLEAREALMEAVSLWGGRISTATDDATIAELQRRFYVTFGVDVGTAQTLNRAEAESLRKRVIECK